MKIDSSNTAIELNAYLKQIKQQQRTAATQQDASRAGQGTQVDKVNVSDRAREVQHAVQALKSMSDVRETKVEQVKMDVDKGTYQVNGAKAATGILRESFENNNILQKIDMRV